MSWSTDFALYLEDIWFMNIILWDYWSVWPDFWPQNKCKSLWPVFHGPVILPYISKTIWCMSVIFSDNETGWSKLWPQNKYRPTWPLFHGLVILLNIFKIVWWMNIIVGIMNQCDTQRLISSSICRSVTFIFSIWWRNVVLGKMDQCDTKTDLIKYMWVSDLYVMVFIH